MLPSCTRPPPPPSSSALVPETRLKMSSSAVSLLQSEEFYQGEGTRGVPHSCLH